MACSTGRAQHERARAEALLWDFLGAERVVWLRSGIAGDDTDGHVDDVARFVAPGKVVCASEALAEDENAAPLREGRTILDGAEDADGRRLDVVPLPMPPAVGSPYGRLPASHANFYIGNAVVLVPTFGGGSDAEAVRTLQALFPSREAVGVDCRALVHGLGAIHCVTQQAPSA